MDPEVGDYNRNLTDGGEERSFVAKVVLLLRHESADCWRAGWMVS
jgi:hypothetical protein